MKTYTPIIGLEIHVELKTKSKMFCGCDAHHFQVEPNTHTCPVCLGLPGALPVPNRKAIEWCQLIGLALNCELAKNSKFDRKNYFYPDLAKGYQISQYDQPLCYKGSVTLSGGKEIGITRVHMEEDTGKNQHKKIDGKEMTLVDFNRSGVPLVEIVTEPDFRSIDEVDEFLKGLRRIIRYLNVSDADMEKGSMRLELNMSLALTPPSLPSDRGGITYSPSFEGELAESHKGVLKLPNYKVEVKNINSFRYVRKAFEYELKRQSEILNHGQVPTQETRGYQEDVDRTISQRSKEDAHEYRYYPEPDIPPMEFSDQELEGIKDQLPELPIAKQARFEREFDLVPETAAFLTETHELAEYFERVAKLGSSNNLDAKTIANAVKNKKVDWKKLNPEEVIKQLNQGKSASITDTKQLEPVIDKVLADNPAVVSNYKAGKTQVLGFLVGQVMKATEGKADAKVVNKLLVEKLKSL